MNEEAAYLRKLCSDVTLQSQKQGFFNQWVEQVESNLPKGFLEKFGELTTDLQRIKTIWKYECVHSLQIQSFSAPKNQKVSEEKRKQGNEAFQAKENSKALQLYSQAVIRAPTYEEDLSLSLANRSAVLFHMEKYDLCLQDIALALSKSYPKRLHYKVHDRKGQCLMKLGRERDAQESFEDALRALDSSELDEPKKQTHVNELKAKIEASRQPMKHPTVEHDGAIHHENLFKGSSPILPKASASLCLKYSDETGRFMAASENIPAGKVLVRERPFSSALMPEKRGSFCEHCFKNLIAPVPCNACSGVAFCSPRCRDKASKSYHRWECPYLNLFKGSGMSLNCFLSLRIITERGLTYFKENYPRLQNRKTQLPLPESPWNPEDYSSFHNLVGLEEYRNVQEFFKRTLMAVFLLKVLQHAGFFSKHQKQVTNISDDESLIGALLLRHLQVIQFNAHEVSGISFDGELKFQKSRSVFLGLAVYPTVSFFNHSCFPAVGRYFDGTEMTIVNLRPFRSGEMVPENYGPIFTHSAKNDRQKKLLSRYWFTCNCEACNEDWPTYSTMPNTITLLEVKAALLADSQVANTSQGQQKRGRKKNKKKNSVSEPAANMNKVNTEEKTNNSNPSLKPPVSPKEGHKDFERGKSLMDAFKREEAISAFIRWIESATNRVKLPLKDYHLAMESLRLLVAARGTYYVLPGTGNMPK